MPMEAKRRTYRTEAYWITHDAMINEKFPVGSIAKYRGRGGQICQGWIRSNCLRGKLEIQNTITGAQYRMSSDGLISPDAKTPEEMEQIRERMGDMMPRPERLSAVRPITRTPKRYEPSVNEIRPWTEDEVIAHTTLGSVCKAVERIRKNADSFRSVDMHELLHAAETLIRVCIKELESYERLPD